MSVADFEEGFNLSLVQKKREDSSSQEMIDQFPILVFDHLDQYTLISGHDNPIDELKLMCRNWSLSFPTADIKEYDLQTLTGWTQITEDQKTNQPCRFMSLHQTHVVGVSQLFPIVFPIKSQLTVNLQSHQKNPPPPQKGVEGIDDLLIHFQRAENLSVYHQAASLEIQNESSTAVDLFLPALSFQTNVHFFYDGLSYRNYLPELQTTIRLDQLGFFVPVENGARFKSGKPHIRTRR